ncbi:MAG: protein phosphatase 2C domain-containing protein [Helicobacteraceae bacterium]|nr:protein phosphatase 2C domain-containing protein [Helicobacteraceae bacterium]
MVKNDYQSFAYTTIGSSHEKEGKICQDASAQYSSGALRIAVVSDGHGEANSFRSDKGAKLAVACAIKAISDFVSQCPKPSDRETLSAMIGSLLKNVVLLWQYEVESDHDKNPFTKEELDGCDERHRKKFEGGDEAFKAYGATLIAAAIAENYWFGFQIGDGRFTALYEDGTFTQPVPWDDRCFLNVTTSICDYNANDRPRVYCDLASESKPPVALFLCSDGIDDNYPVEDNEKHLYKLYLQTAIAFANDGYSSTCEQIKELCDSFAKKGKGDDSSLAILVDMKRIKDSAQRAKAKLEAQKPPPPKPAETTSSEPKVIALKKEAPSDPKASQTSNAPKNGAKPNIASVTPRQREGQKAYEIFALKIIALLTLAALALFAIYIAKSPKDAQTLEIAIAAGDREETNASASADDDRDNLADANETQNDETDDETDCEQTINASDDREEANISPENNETEDDITPNANETQEVEADNETNREEANASASADGDRDNVADANQTQNDETDDETDREQNGGDRFPSPFDGNLPDSV